MTVEPDAADESSREPDVRAALDRMLASDLFRASPQLAVFLRYVVEAALRGDGDRIKGYTIGVEAFGRGADFDPQTDPIVRVEATRLRRTLDRYYAEAGAAEPVIIDLPRGSYVPTFRWRQPDDDAAAVPDAEIAPLPPRRPLAGIAIALIAAVAVLAAGVLWQGLADRNPGDRLSGGQLPHGNGMPVLAVQAFEILGVPQSSSVSGTALVDKLRNAFALFEGINVVSNAGGTSGSSPRQAEPAAVDYRLVGTVDYHQDGSADIRVRLLDLAEGTVVWSHTAEGIPATAERAAREDALVTELATRLLIPYGVIRSHDRIKLLAGGRADPRYRCMIDAFESFRSYDPAEQTRARTCLEQLTTQDPSFAMGFAYLAGIHVRQHQQLDAPANQSPLLDRAFALARRAVELQPLSARAHYFLFAVEFTRRNIATAFAIGDKAIALNKYDLSISTDYGGRLILVGELDRGMQLLRVGPQYSPVLPAWYHFYFFLGGYLQGDMATAALHAAQIVPETYPLGFVARALAAASAGDHAGAQEIVGRLVTLWPAWRADPQRELGRIIVSAEIIDRLVRDLGSAGLSIDR